MRFRRFFIYCRLRRLFYCFFSLREKIEIYSARFYRCADFFVKLDRRTVPVETAPFKTRIALFFNNFSEFEKEFFAETFATVFGFYEQIFNMNVGFSRKRAVFRKAPNRLSIRKSNVNLFRLFFLLSNYFPFPLL